MDKFEKFISLSSASLISGYHQDYLSSLIRKKEIKGKKLGGSWFTTEEEIKNYVFKQQIKSKSRIIKSTLSFLRANNGLIYALLLLAVLSIGVYFYNQVYSEIEAQNAHIENLISGDTESEDEIQDLAF